MTLTDRLRQIFGATNEKALVRYEGELPPQKWTHYDLNVADNYKEWETIWRNNPIVQGCISAYALTMPEAPLAVRDGEELTRNHPLFDGIISGPLSPQSEHKLWNLTYTAIGLGGNAYWHKRREGNVVRGVRLLTDEVITPIPDGYGDIAYYHFKSGLVEAMIPREDIVHISGFWTDPDMPWKGASPVALASTSAKSYNEAMAAVYSMLKNDATPRTVFNYAEELSQEQQAALAETFGRKYGGVNRGKAAHIWGIQSIHRLGMDMQQLAVEELTTSFEANICSVYRVHPIVAMTAAGLSASTYANFEQASRDFTSYSRVPFWDMVASQVMKGFAQEYPDLQLEFDLTFVQSLQPDPDMARDQIVAAYTAGVATQNEARAVLGLEPLDGGDVTSAPAVPVTLAAPADVITKNGPSPFDSDEVWVKAIDDLTQEAADDIARGYRRVFRSLEDNVIESATGGDQPTGNINDIDWEEWEGRFLEGTAEARRQMVDDVINLALNDVGSGIPDLGDDYQRVRMFGINESSDKISESVGTIRDDLRETLRNNAGLKASELQAILREKFTTLSGARIEAIARTTATASAGKTQQSTFEKLNEREPDPARKIRRRWVALPGARADHANARGTYEDDNGMFTVGAETTPYPAGPGLSAKNAVNCRCYTRAIREGRR